MNNTKKNLDILEEQMFNILKEYVPQTGRGFSDGAEYVGMNTKGPYERTEEIEEDKPWYKKKYKEDSKNLKILIGHGSKTPKFAKKGGPFTQDPPKRRPVNKLSAPPMALDEVALPQSFKDAFLKITNAEVSFKALKDINAKVPIFGDVLAFKQGKTYQGIISGNDFSVKATEKGDQTLTKQKFLEKLEQAQGELCQSIDCDASTIKSNGKTLTFNQFMNEVESSAPSTEAPSKEIKTNEDAQIVGEFSNKVNSGVRVDKAIKQTIGYNPIARKFAKTFYDTANEAISKLKNPDEKKAAALVTILFGEVASVPVELTTGIITTIDPSVYKAIGGFFEEIKKTILGPLMEPIAELKGLYAELKDTIKTTKQFVSGLTAVYDLPSLPEAQGTQTGIVVIGDKQKNNLKEAFKEFFQSKNYTFIKSFDFEKNTSAAQIASDSSLKQFILENKEKIGLFFISLGSENALNAAGESNLLSGFLKSSSNGKIVWVGSFPIKKEGIANIVELGIKNSSIQAANLAIQTASHNPLQRFIFIDPFSYIRGDEGGGVYDNPETISVIGAKKVLDGVLGVKSKKDGKITVDDSDLNLLNVGEFIDGVISIGKFKLLDEDLKKELIKLSKRAKQEFGDNAKVYIQSGIRNNSHNHAPGEAADLRISVDGTNKSAQETYAFIISSIIDGTIKDGGVGYYANNTGYYDPEAMDVETEFPHYDIRGKRKWFWFKCNKADINSCKAKVNSKYFNPRTEEVEEKDADGNVIKDDKGKVKTKRVQVGPEQFQTSGAFSANDVASASNPLALPKDVLKFLNVSAKPAAAIKKENLSTEFTDPEVLTKEQINEKYNLNPAEDFKKDRYQIRENFGGFKGYIKGLWQIYQANKSSLLSDWPSDKIKETIKKYADMHNVKRYIMFGIIIGESNFTPTGLYGQSPTSKGSPALAIDKNSTAYGVGGVTSETYDGIKNKMSNKVPHYMLWNPEYAIEAAVLSIKFNLNYFKNDLNKALMSYAGEEGTGQKKIIDVQKMKELMGDV